MPCCIVNVALLDQLDSNFLSPPEVHAKFSILIKVVFELESWLTVARVHPT